MGRSKQFDEQEVLNKAVMCFWENGYDNTTVRQLEEDMGINQFSIYASFQNKNELYKRVLVNYTQILDKLFLKGMKKKDADLITIEKFLKKFASYVKNKKVPNSCMIVNSALRMESYDEDIQTIIMTFFSSMHQLFAKAIKNSIDNGLVPPDTDIEMTSEYLVGIAQSISSYSKVRTKPQIKKYIRYALARLEA